MSADRKAIPLDPETAIIVWLLTTDERLAEVRRLVQSGNAMNLQQVLARAVQEPMQRLRTSADDGERLIGSLAQIAFQQVDVETIALKLMLLFTDLPSKGPRFDGYLSGLVGSNWPKDGTDTTS